MATKYAAARDRAYAWRTEYRKVRTENRSLRRVYTASLDLLRLLDELRPVLPIGDAIRYTNAIRELEAATRGAVFAVTDDDPVAQGKKPRDCEASS